MLGYEFSARIASNNSYFTKGEQPFLRFDGFHVHGNSGHPIEQHQVPFKWDQKLAKIVYCCGLGEFGWLGLSDQKIAVELSFALNS